MINIMPFKDLETRRQYLKEYMRKYRLSPEYKEKEKAYGRAYGQSERGKPKRDKWKLENPDAPNKFKIRLRLDTLLHYGDKCICCGENNINFLSIDHINGIKPEKEITGKRMSGKQLYDWLKKNNYPNGFQILCFNCNMAQGFFGFCH